ncbi:RteC domain-containing protein [Myroides sp. LJL119]
MLKTGFSDKYKEIRFFKHQKPAIVAKLIYYNAIYKIEAKRPFGGKEVLQDYYNKELSKLKRFFDNLYKSLVFNRYSFFLKTLK